MDLTRQSSSVTGRQIRLPFCGKVAPLIGQEERHTRFTEKLLMLQYLKAGNAVACAGRWNTACRVLLALDTIGFILLILLSTVGLAAFEDLYGDFGSTLPRATACLLGVSRVTTPTGLLLGGMVFFVTAHFMRSVHQRTILLGAVALCLTIVEIGCLVVLFLPVLMMRP